MHKKDKELTRLAPYSKKTANIRIPIDDSYDFTRLCANALVRGKKQEYEKTYLFANFFVEKKG